MIAVIFELQADDGQRETYLNLAAELKPLLAEIDGFISIERFQSLADPQRLLSLSFWRDEAAVQQWRNIEQHRAAQARGRHDVLAHYRLRVAEVVRDYGLDQREQAPQDSRGYHVGSEKPA
ncbi:Antibiotic biosynthesis monooxygenase [Serratia grimesii]|uniref:antibiotic biosynthesis monooxygenase family protein n=1 Tax=Serratia grimesii TaxID=82995 RepID=UPI00217A57EC|nr:antibiotic biosynthesis monooxygenase [Serratia grimesii]CAI1511451.1 Antibiotic biosynthesis monooxygenase [Serratia grimesii]